MTDTTRAARLNPAAGAWRLEFGFLNLGHFFTHLMMLLHTVAVLQLGQVFGLSYGRALMLSAPGFVAFGLGSLPAGWLGDRYSRRAMLRLFFVGIGGSAVLTGLAQTAMQLMAALFLIGLFASIYHPVGIAMVVRGASGAGRVGRALGVNGVWGNMGIAGAALIGGLTIDWIGWRAAFILPGLAALGTGLAYVVRLPGPAAAVASGPATGAPTAGTPDRRWVIRVMAVIAIATLLGGINFNAVTVGLPKLFAERLPELAPGIAGVGVLVSIVAALAAFTQVLVGNLIDRYPIKPILLVMLALQVTLLATVAQLGEVATMIVATVMMCALFGEIPINDTLVARVTRGGALSRVYAVKYLLTFAVSASAVPLVAVAHESYGFGALFGLLAAFSAVAALVVLVGLPGEKRGRVVVWQQRE